MTPHKAYTLENIRPISELSVPVQEERPVPQVIECYLNDTADIKPAEIAHMHLLPDYDAYKVYLKDGRTFEVSGPALFFYETTAVD